MNGVDHPWVCDMVHEPLKNITENYSYVHTCVLCIYVGTPLVLLKYVCMCGINYAIDIVESNAQEEGGKLRPR